MTWAVGILLSCDAVLAAPRPGNVGVASRESISGSATLHLMTELTRRVEPGGIQVDMDDLSLRMGSGWVVPIATGRGEPRPLGDAILGFVWVGDGDVTFRLPDRADAITLANRLVRDLGYEDDGLWELATREVLTTAADAAIIISSTSEASEWLSRSDAGGRTEPHEIVVYADRNVRDAERRAQSYFDKRTALYDELGIRLIDDLVTDRALRSSAGEGWVARRSLIDVHTSQRFGIASTSRGVFASDDKWIALLHDDTGATDSRRRSQLVSMGRNEGGIARSGRIGGTPFPPLDPSDPSSAPAPPVRMQPEHAVVRIATELASHKQQLYLNVEAELQLRAVGGSVQLGAFELPATGNEGTWHMVDLATADGVPVTYRMHASRIAFALPTPIAEGESASLRLTTRGVFSLGQRPICGNNHSFESSAPTTEQLSYLPRVGRWATGDTWQVEVEVVTRPKDGLIVLAGGQSTLERDVGQLRIRYDTPFPMRQPEIVFGRWKGRRVEPTHAHLPSVSVYAHRVHPEVMSELPSEVRRIVDFLSGWLPDLPSDSLDVAELHPLCLKRVPTGLRMECELFEAPAGCGQRLRIPGQGSFPLRQWSGGGRCYDLADDVPSMGNGVLAHNAAHQYWGQLARPAHDEDHWIVESLAELYSCMYVAAAFGSDACEKRMERARVRFEGIEARWGAALSGAYSSEDWDDRVWLYGPYVLLKMLRPRIGSDRFFAALDMLLRDHPREPITTERLQHYFELASGRDLTDFFDFWIHQGMIPSLELQWSTDEEGRVRGTLTSDIPFGHFDVPVRIRTKHEETWLLVDVIDGVGSFSVRTEGKLTRVELDPSYLVLARKREVRRM